MYKLLPLIPIALIMANPVVASDLALAKQIVAERCHLCHGADGEASSAVYPRIAGQHKEYMIKQLTDFRSGKRKGTMNEMAANLTDDEILALADYFSAKPPLTHKIRDKDLEAVGRYIYHKGNKYSGVAACSGCHGENGHGSKDLPRLAGQHKRYVTSQLEDFNQRTRTNDNAIMGSIASQLTELEINAVSLYVSGLK